jgi:hypothetical protein
MTNRLSFSLAALSGLAAILLPAPSLAQFVPSVYVGGLNNPHGLTFGSDGALYIAEAGIGGNGPSIPGGEGPVSYGASGAVTRYLNGNRAQVVTGLPSLAGAGGFAATGLQDLAFSGSTLYGVIGLGANPAARAALGAPGNDFGQLVRLDTVNNAWQNVADIAGYEALNNPDLVNPNASPIPDSNPYSLAVGAGGVIGVADAGGNTLLSVNPTTGAISTLAVLPEVANTLPFGPPTVDAVPTSLALGPDGAFYAGQLTGGPFPPGGASVYRLDPTTGLPTVAFAGFTNITDIAFGPDGDLYVLQLDDNGLALPGGTGGIVRIDSATQARTNVIDGLFFPTGLAFGPDGALYVSNGGILPGGGQVLRLQQVPEPGTMALLMSAIVGGAGIAYRRRRK